MDKKSPQQEAQTLIDQLNHAYLHEEMETVIAQSIKEKARKSLAGFSDERLKNCLQNYPFDIMLDPYMILIKYECERRRIALNSSSHA